MKLFKRFTVFALALFYQQNLFAANLVYNIGYSLGGDKLGTVTYGGRSDNLYAGQGVDMGFGFEVQHGASKRFATQLTYGFTYGGAGTNVGGAEWYNNYLQLAEFIRTSSAVRWGVGVVSSMSPKAYTYGTLSGAYDERFADALGYVLIAEINTAHSGRNGIAMGIKYTNITYSTTTYNGIDVSSLNAKRDGSSLAFYVGWLW